MLERRDILDAPLALTSDKLLLSDPTPDELLKPALFVKAAPDAAPVPADGKRGSVALALSTTSSCCSSCCSGTLTLSVVHLQSVYEGTPTTPGFFRFSAAYCGPNPPSSVSVGFSLSGVAIANTDYSGALTSGTASVQMTVIGPSNSSGFLDVNYTAVDDDLDEPPSESVIVTLTDYGPNNFLSAPAAGAVEDGNPVTFVNEVTVKNHPWISQQGLIDTHNKDGLTAMFHQVVPKVEGGRKSFEIKLKSATIWINATSEAKRGIYGHEQKHITSIISELTKLANDRTNKDNTKAKLEQMIDAIFAKEANHTNPQSPEEGNITDYEPVDGEFPPQPVPGDPPPPLP